ncbi:FkbM family methyltransferase [Variovorax sp. CAN2819]|uniref:FkbM family methyltransferase n=1 Tax=Variovorax sp. CAN15 TaxID=3046727 RepID=UPI002649DA25|nr:FkbM family methyltransferase [Variovorax sp. CAN15]MDN6885964.1 FkbM family methyltransferase [Variovorax sp. CAN15]
MTQKNSPKAFTSYAQNFEDVMLWRALKHVPAGVYVDIGAQHPVVDSVSKAFYEQGWRGVHVEPVPYYAELLRQDRPDEVVLQLALSHTAGILDLHVIKDTGLSTGVKAYADVHQAEHGFAYMTVPTPMLPMKTALASLAGRTVHWLKIDVEGLEEEVLRGWDSNILRPWIIVVEATVPMSTELRHEGAERILVEAGYRFAYFDGLNRFYVAEEHANLLPALNVPPNVFDYAELSGLSGTWCNGLIARHREELRASAAQLEAERAERAQFELRARAELRDARTALEDARNRAHEAAMRTVQAEAQATIAEARASFANERARDAEARALQSAATPLRRLASAAMEGRITSGVKRRIKTALRVVAITIGRHPQLKRAATLTLRCVPPLRHRLQAMLAPPPNSAPQSAPERPLPMSPDTALVYRQLHQRQQRSRHA